MTFWGIDKFFELLSNYLHFSLRPFAPSLKVVTLAEMQVARGVTFPFTTPCDRPGDGQIVQVLQVLNPF